MRKTPAGASIGREQVMLGNVHDSVMTRPRPRRVRPAGRTALKVR